MADKYFEKYGVPAVENEDDLFFYGSAGYHKHEPNLEFSQEKISIRFYEIVTKQQESISEYYYIIIHDYERQLGHDNEKYFLRFYDEEGTPYNIEVVRFRNLDLFVAMNEENNTSLIPKSAFTDKKIVSFYVAIDTSDDQTKAASSIFSVQFKSSDWTIKSVLLESTHVRVLARKGIYPVNVHTTQEFISTFWWNMLFYVIGLAITTYALFFRRYTFRKK